jgi:hypothetical protein
VIASDEVGAELCANLAEWRHRMAQIVDRTVDEVTGNRDDVGLERVDFANDVFDKIATDGQADVHVGELYEA